MVTAPLPKAGEAAKKLDEMGVGEEAQGYAVMAGDEELEQEMTVSSVIDARLTVHPSCLVLVPKMLHRFVLREPRYWVHLDNPYHRYAVRTATTHAKCLAELASHEENVQAQKPRP